MKAVVAVTDNDWYRHLRDKHAAGELDEANFWRPGGGSFRALDPGELFLFKLHAPLNKIAGGGLFAHYSRVPYRTAWEWFGDKNGATSLTQMRERIQKYRRDATDPFEDYEIGCIILTDLFFLERDEWIPVPDDFSRNIVTYKTYDLREGAGRELWEQVQLRLQARRVGEQELWKDAVVVDPKTGSPMYGEPTLIRPRLGQGAFRSLITDTYRRRCAISGEKALPVLEAGHIRPVSEGGQHEVGNGLLLRADIHRLFDKGYVTVSPDHRFHVSPRLRTEFDNGEPYFPFDGEEIWVPPDAAKRPAPEFLEWHADAVFRR